MSVLSNFMRFVDSPEDTDKNDEFDTPAEPSGFKINSAAFEILIFKKPSYQECGIICDRFRDGHAVILSFEDSDSSLISRILDFFSGVACALDGDLTKISNTVYIVSPENISVSEVMQEIPE